MESEAILEGLNPEQRRAVETTEGPLLVLAGAGSGKTRVLTSRIAYLIGICGIPPESILAVTFTNKAAGEMRERVEKMLGPGAEGVWLSTFHSTCVRVLRRDIGHLGFSRGFAIYDQADSLALVKEGLRRKGLEDRIDARRMDWRIDQWKNAGMSPAEASDQAADFEMERAAEIYALYQRMLADANALDFGDLLMKTVELFERFPDVLAHYRRRWQYVLIDEYQDTNRVQYKLVQQLAADHRNLCVVGDPDQCLPPHARVQTPDGPKAISEIRAGDRVVGGSGWGKHEAMPVEKAMTRPYEGRLLRIRTAGGRTLDATPNHMCFGRTEGGSLGAAAVSFTMFGGVQTEPEPSWHEHTVELVTSDPDLASRVGGQFETSRKDYDAGLELAERICALDGLDLVSRARLTPGGAFTFMPASHLCVGMTIPVVEGEEVVEGRVESVESEHYEGEVYDLSVPNLRNFSAEGVLVHNSIYAWRGADVRNILDFEEDYPDVDVVRLERNYRSTQPILEGASGVIAHNLARKEKSLFTEREGGNPIRVFDALDDREEAQWVVREILAAREEGRPLGHFAIFYRTNSQSRLFEEELLKYDVPHVVVGGVRFYERAEVKDALAYLRLLVNPTDAMALRRIVNRPARGIGKTTVERAAVLADDRGAPLAEGLRLLLEQGGSTRTAPKVRAFLDLLDSLRNELEGASAAEALALILDRSGYLAALEKDGSPEAEARLDNLRELLSAADDFRREAEGVEDERSEIESFLDQVALVSDIDSFDSREDCVSLMTVHTAKGLEFPRVFVVGLEEGIFPHAGSLRDERGIEEERRLCYVAMTRAMEQLTLTSAQERMRFGSRSYNPASRFLREIPESVTESAGGRARLRGRAAREARKARAIASRDDSFDYSYSQETVDEGGPAPGMRVRHPVFGGGKILSVEGSGAKQALRIQFDRAGVKKILVRFAQLELG